MKNKLREEIAQEFINSLKENVIPWEQEWVGGERAFNPVTGTRYRGTNAFWLAWKAHLNDYQDPRWCTFAQAQNNGWKIKPGSKGTKIEFFSPYDRQEKRKITYRELAKLQETLSLEELKARISYPSATYTVFNGAQIEGIPDYKVQTPEWNKENVIAARDNLFKNMELAFHEGGNQAFYRKSNDSITLPEISQFKSEYGYMATMLHEAGHATGAKKRLNRDMSHSFGSEGYAREELRAEIASAFTAQEIGISGAGMEHTNNHKAYIQNWISVLQNEPQELFKAIKDAEQISDYLLEKGEFDLILEQSKAAEINNIEYTEQMIKVNEDLQEYVTEHKALLDTLKQEKTPVVINGYGGPGAGKSTACMNICAALKIAGYHAEYVQEYAKELVYDKNLDKLNGSAENQFDILKEQTKRLDRLYDQVDFIVTDSPVLLNTVYNNQLTPEYSSAVNELYNQYTNFSFFIGRDASTFEQEGRIHTLEQSIQKDNEIRDLLDKNGIYYGEYNHDTVDVIIDNVIKTYERINAGNIKLEDLENDYFKIQSAAKRLELKFDGKPSQSVRSALKDNQFRWDPKSAVWHHYLNENAKAAVQNLIKELDTISKNNQTIVEKDTAEPKRQSFEQRTYDYEALEKNLLNTAKKKLDRNTYFERDTENCLLDRVQAARLRMGLKGREQSLDDFIKDAKLPSALKGDFVKVGQVTQEYINQGMKIEDIITSMCNEISVKAVIGDVPYTKNLICSMHSNTLDEYNDLKSLPELYNMENMARISPKLAERLVSGHFKVFTPEKDGTMDEVRNLKELLELQEPEYYAMKENLQDIMEQSTEIFSVVKCEWSEAAEFEGNTFYTLKEYDNMMRRADTIFVKERAVAMRKYESEEDFYENAGREDIRYTGYEKNKFTLHFGTRSIEERQDIGDGEGGIVEHFENISSLQELVEPMKEAISNETAFEEFQGKLKEVFDYEEENNIPEAFRTTTEKMEVISKEMLLKQHDLISAKMEQGKVGLSNPALEILKDRVPKMAKAKSPGFGMEL